MFTNDKIWLSNTAQMLLTCSKLCVLVYWTRFHSVISLKIVLAYKLCVLECHFFFCWEPFFGCSSGQEVHERCFDADSKSFEFDLEMSGHLLVRYRLKPANHCLVPPEASKPSPGSSCSLKSSGASWSLKPSPGTAQSLKTIALDRLKSEKHRPVPSEALKLLPGTSWSL